MRLGNKGSLYVELRAEGPNADSHARFGGVFPNPIWKLAWALASIRRPDGHVLLPGFYDVVVPPSPAEEQLYEQLAANAKPLLERYGLQASFPPRSDKAMMVELYAYPTCNVAGIGGGYMGSGSKTIVPSEAFAKLEFKLVPNQDPDVLFESLRHHLNEYGFRDVELICHSRGYPSKTPLDHPFAALVAETGKRVFGRPLTVEPISSGTGPRYVITRWSSMPIVAIGVSHAGSMIHGPNENIRLDHFKAHVKHVVTLMHALAFGPEG
jgi:acetylornithine deacetylase/succinyl-diaminopimelate desuccinylase-like protein